MSTECVRLFSPFKSTVKGADVAIAGEIIHNDLETGEAFVKVTERFFGHCQDTIRIIEFIYLKSGDKIIVLLHKWNNKEDEYHFDECGTHVLYFNYQKNKYFGNITHFNGFICRTLSFCRIYKFPTNHMNYQRIENFVKRKNMNKKINEEHSNVNTIGELKQT